MRHYILIISFYYKFLLIFILGLYVETIQAQEFKAGALLTLVSSQVDGDQSAGYHKIGYRTGLYSRFVFNTNWSLSTELAYVGKGSQHSNTDDQLQFRIKLHYVEISALLNFHLNNQWCFSPGLSYGRLIKSSVDDPYGTVNEDYLSYRNADYNVHAAIKYNWHKHWAVDLRMAYSLRSITSTNPYQYNNLLSIGLFYEY